MGGGDWPSASSGGKTHPRKQGPSCKNSRGRGLHILHGFGEKGEIFPVRPGWAWPIGASVCGGYRTPPPCKPEREKRRNIRNFAPRRGVHLAIAGDRNAGGHSFFKFDRSLHKTYRAEIEGQVAIAMHVQSFMVLAQIQGKTPPAGGGVALGLQVKTDRPNPAQSPQRQGEVDFGVPLGSGYQWLVQNIGAIRAARGDFAWGIFFTRTAKRFWRVGD